MITMFWYVMFNENKAIKQAALNRFKSFLFKKIKCNKLVFDDAEMFTSEVHDPYARTTGT